jgi:ElaB/YqjD/DUF883 family membrane-anchored ribosome-binding protein
MAEQQDHSQILAQELQQIVHHAQSLVDATSGELDDRIKSARVALKERLEAVQGEYGRLEDRLWGNVQAADTAIHEKPYYAIGGTFLAGLFLGWLLCRK